MFRTPFKYFPNNKIMRFFYIITSYININLFYKIYNDFIVNTGKSECVYQGLA